MIFRIRDKTLTICLSSSSLMTGGAVQSMIEPNTKLYARMSWQLEGFCGKLQQVRPALRIINHQEKEINSFEMKYWNTESVSRS